MAGASPFYLNVEEQEAMKEKISLESKEAFSNYKNILNNFVFKEKWMMCDYFLPHEASVLIYDYEPNNFDFDKNKKLITHETFSSLSMAYNNFLKYQDIYSSIGNGEYEASESLVDTHYKITGEINNMYRILCDALIHNQLPYNQVTYHGYVKYHKVHEIKVYRDDIKELLIRKNIKSKFFGTHEITKENALLPPHLDPENPLYSQIIMSVIKLREILITDPPFPLSECKNHTQKLVDWIGISKNADLIGFPLEARNSENMKKHVVALAKWESKEN